MLKECFSTNLGVITVNEKGHTALSIDPYLSYIFNPIPLEKGARIQEGSLFVPSYALCIPSWGTFGLVILTGGPGLPSLAPSPPFSLNGQVIWMPSPVDTHG